MKSYVDTANTSIQLAINSLESRKANLASPSFTGVPISITAATGTSNTMIATTAFVNNLANSGYIFSSSITGNAGTVTNGVYTNGTYNNPSWITGLAGSKISGDISVANVSYSGTFTGSTGVLNIGSGQIYKDASGNTGIGTASPGYKLDVNGSINSTGLYVNGTPYLGGAAITDDVSSAGPYYPGMSSITSGAWTQAYTSSTKLYFTPSTGTLSSTNFSSLSDAELKDNVTPLSNSMEVIGKINPVSFNWKDTGNKSYGVIAQELEELLPQLIETNPDTGLKSVSYTQLIPFLIDVVKELSQKVKELENK